MPPTGMADTSDRSIHARVRFYAQLNDFLPEEKRGRDIDVSYVVSPSVKDAIEALGVPHVEVDLILVNGRSIGFGRRVAPGDRISVYPSFQVLDISTITHVETPPVREMLFVADVHLRRLAHLLRLLGFDVLHSATYDDAMLINISMSEDRILLTRDRALLKHGALTHGYWVRSVHPHQQAVEVVRRFDLAREVRSLTRCPVCNGLLQCVEKQKALDRIPPKTARWLDAYVECVDCGKLYWEGTHTDRIHAEIEKILNESGKP